MVATNNNMLSVVPILLKLFFSDLVAKLKHIDATANKTII